MRVGVIGMGFGASMVAPAYEQTAGCEVVDVVSPRDVGAVADLCRRRDVDLISVHSPPFLHERDVTLAVENGHHVLCDKPFGRTLDEAERMLDLATGAGVIHLANFEFRLEPWRQAIRGLIRNDVLGRVESIAWHHQGSAWLDVRDGWLLDADLGGGWIGAAMSHPIDTMRWFVGDLSVVGGVLFRHDDDQGRAEDGGVVVLSSSTGVLCTINSTAMASQGRRPWVVVAGRAATVELSTDGWLRLDGAEWPAHTVRPEPDPRAYASAVKAWCPLVRDRIDDQIDDADDPLPTLADGVAFARTHAEIRSTCPVVTRPVASR